MRNPDPWIIATAAAVTAAAVAVALFLLALLDASGVLLEIIYRALGGQ